MRRHEVDYHYDPKEDQELEEEVETEEATRKTEDVRLLFRSVVEQRDEEQAEYTAEVNKHHQSVYCGQWTHQSPAVLVEHGLQNHPQKDEVESYETVLVDCVYVAVEHAKHDEESASVGVGRVFQLRNEVR